MGRSGTSAPRTRHAARVPSGPMGLPPAVGAGHQPGAVGSLLEVVARLELNARRGASRGLVQSMAHQLGKVCRIEGFSAEGAVLGTTGKARHCGQTARRPAGCRHRPRLHRPFGYKRLACQAPLQRQRKRRTMTSRATVLPPAHACSPRPRRAHLGEQAAADALARVARQ